MASDFQLQPQQRSLTERVSRNLMRSSTDATPVSWKRLFDAAESGGETNKWLLVVVVPPPPAVVVWFVCERSVPVILVELLFDEEPPLLLLLLLVLAPQPWLLLSISFMNWPAPPPAAFSICTTLPPGCCCGWLFSWNWRHCCCIDVVVVGVAAWRLPPRVVFVDDLWRVEQLRWWCWLWCRCRVLEPAAVEPVSAVVS